MGGFYVLFVLTPLLLILGITFVCMESLVKTGVVLLLTSLVSLLIGFSLCSKQRVSYIPTEEEMMEMEEESNAASDTLNVDTIQ